MDFTYSSKGEDSVHGKIYDVYNPADDNLGTEDRTVETKEIESSIGACIDNLLERK